MRAWSAAPACKGLYLINRSHIGNARQSLGRSQSQATAHGQSPSLGYYRDEHRAVAWSHWRTGPVGEGGGEAGVGMTQFRAAHDRTGFGGGVHDSGAGRGVRQGAERQCGQCCCRVRGGGACSVDGQRLAFRAKRREGRMAGGARRQCLCEPHSQ